MLLLLLLLLLLGLLAGVKKVMLRCELLLLLMVEMPLLCLLCEHLLLLLHRRWARRRCRGSGSCEHLLLLLHRRWARRHRNLLLCSYLGHLRRCHGSTLLHSSLCHCRCLLSLLHLCDLRHGGRLLRGLLRDEHGLLCNQRANAEREAGDQAYLRSTYSGDQIGKKHSQYGFRMCGPRPTTTAQV